MKKDFLKELKSQGYLPKSMLDVGAHVGTFTREFLTTFPDCVPTLMEPNPHCSEELSRLGHEVHCVAASNEEGRGELFLTKEWLQSTGCSLYRENTSFFRDDVVLRQEIVKRRIDDLFKGRSFDFVKIDTQGAELDVLNGGESVLGQAEYILVEVSLVEYNAGGARAEAVFGKLDEMGFHCSDVTEFHRLSSVQNGNLLQLDVLFERRRASRALDLPAVSNTRAIDPHVFAGLQRIAGSLSDEGRNEDALLLLGHLDTLQKGNVEILRQVIRSLGLEGRTLEAIEKLSALKMICSDVESLVSEIRMQLPAAIECFNAQVSKGNVVGAEQLAGALSQLVPGNAALLNSALSCNLALGRTKEAAQYATALLRIDPNHSTAKSILAHITATAPAETGDVKRRVSDVLSPTSSIHPLLRLRDMNDLASLILCDALSDAGIADVELLVRSADALKVDVPHGTEWAGWLKHYRVAFDALDLPGVIAETPPEMPSDEIAFVSYDGKTLDWRDLSALTKRLKAKVVFSAAADRAYVDLYARWYIKSILKYCDVNGLIIIHVIGGRKDLKKIALSLGINDERLVLSGDAFDAGRVTTKCFDAPPKGLIEKPVAHFQSVRFLRLGALLQKLELPVFVSDIDLLLQRGVSDLMQRCTKADIVLNENTHNTNAGSRLTANLLLIHPTANSSIFLRFLRSYLERALRRPEVSRWIDQFGLLMARHHLQRHGRNPKIEYFDTNSDINNVMYKSYQKHPFRFLSLYHGFDTSSLELEDAAVQSSSVVVKLPKRKPKDVRVKKGVKTSTARRRIG